MRRLNRLNSIAIMSLMMTAGGGTIAAPVIDDLSAGMATTVTEAENQWDRLDVNTRLQVISYLSAPDIAWMAMSHRAAVPAMTAPDTGVYQPPWTADELVALKKHCYKMNLPDVLNILGGGEHQQPPPSLVGYWLDSKCLAIMQAINGRLSPPRTIRVLTILYDMEKYLEWLRVMDEADARDGPLVQFTISMDDLGWPEDNPEVIRRFFASIANSKENHLIEELKIRLDQITLAEVEPALKGMPRLRTLRLLSGIESGYMPAFLKNLALNNKQLETLSIDGRIDDESADALAALVAASNTLTKLVLWDTELQGDRFIQLMNGIKKSRTIQDLFIVEGALIREASVAEALADALAETPNLRGLTLVRCGINHEAIRIFAPYLTRIEALVLRGNEIGDDGAIALAKALSENDSIEHLELDQSDIGDRGAIALGKVSVKTLDLDKNQIGDEGVAGLLHNTQLTDLALSENRIGDVGARHLAQALAGDNSNLQYLRLIGNQIRDEGAALLTDALTAREVKNQAILRLDGNPIGNSGALRVMLAALNDPPDNWAFAYFERTDIPSEEIKLLMKMVLDNKKLDKLQNLKLNHIGDAELVALATGLAAARDIQVESMELGFDNAHIGSEAAVALAEFLSTSTTLKTLHLKHVRMDSAAVEALGAGLMASQSLTSLKLFGVPIDHVAAETLSRSLGAQLRSLELAECQLDDQAIAQLAPAFTQLRTLNLAQNQIDNEGAIELMQVVPHLHTLNLAQNQIGDQGAIEIARALKRQSAGNAIGRDIDDGADENEPTNQDNNEQNDNELRNLNLAGNRIGTQGGGGSRG